MNSHKEMPRQLVNQRLGDWVKSNPTGNSEYVWHLKDDNNIFPEVQLADKARFRLLGRPQIRKRHKPWLLEYKWHNKDDFFKYNGGFWSRRRIYTEDWQGNNFGSKFISLSAARSHFRSMRPQSYWDQVSGRDWRIRNTQTGEIYSYNLNPTI